MKKFFISLIMLTALNVHGQKGAFNVDVFGNGEPVILLSGFASSDNMWNQVIENLKSKYQFHVITIAGLGNVPPVDTPILKTVKNELINYVMENNLNRPVLIGDGLGALMSLWTAGEKPSLFSKILCVDIIPFKSGVTFSPAYSEETQKNPVYNLANAAVKFMAMPQTTFQKNLNKVVLNYVKDPKQAILISKWIAQSDHKTLGNLFSEMKNINPVNNFVKIDIPVLLLSGLNGSKDVTEKMLEARYRLLPKKNIIIVPTKKNIIYDDPIWFREQVKNFLANGIAN
jgi:pimeloyl-ACP methyl ester carboxylesterase